MKNWWNNLKIRSKIVILSFSVILIFAVMVFGYIIPVMEDSLVAQKREKIKDVVPSTMTILDSTS